jgi:AraC family ethanolamine operon transcriptional activator
MTLAHARTAAPVLSPPPPDAVLVRETRAGDVDEHVEQLRDWNLSYEQMDCGRFEGRFTDIRWPGMQLFVEKTTRRVRQRGHLMADSIGIAALLEGQGEIAVNAVRAGTDSLLACDGTEIDICTPADCTVAGIVVDRGPLVDTARRLGLGSILRPGSLACLTPAPTAMRRWRETLVNTATTLSSRPTLLADAAVRDRVQQDLLVSLVDAISGGCKDDAPPGLDHRKRMVDRACEMLLSRPDDPPTLAEVCHRVGASPRKLGYCFQDVLGISPAKYVKAVRLNAVRRELARSLDAATSVYDVAARWGFWHFGHFSSDYKKQFAELPSETLRRARVPAAA